MWILSSQPIVVVFVWLLSSFYHCSSFLFVWSDGIIFYPLRPKRTVYKSIVRPALLYGSEALCLKDSEIGILQRTGRSMVRAMCGVQLKDRKRSTDLMFMLGLRISVHQLAMANCVRWYGHVLRRVDGHVLRGALQLEVEGQRKKGRLIRTWRRKVEEESWKVGLIREDALC